MSKKFYIPFIFISLVVIAGGFIFAVIQQDNNTQDTATAPLVPELTEKTQTFLDDIGIDLEEEERFIVIKNKKYTKESSEVSFLEDKDQNKFVLINNDDTQAEVHIYDQPEGSDLALGIGISAGESVAIPLPLPGTYRFSFMDDRAQNFTLTVVQP
ncbi:MAG TPA: hypothetical protein PLD54_03660 [Candidatus Levybacteria bacterium]|nr:hypothetical protein [Candidatus Levybacteria bacterium]